MAPLFDWLNPGVAGAHVRDVRLFSIALLALAALAGWLWARAALHRRRLGNIPLRIHVAGTRGKSTTTRMIAAGLRAGGRRTLAKTTGSEPRLIGPDGLDREFRRRGPASIVEQMRLLSEASSLRAQALVVECMAIRPEMIDASERHLVRATSLVITNVRSDHEEELGADPDAMARAIAWALPPGGRVFMTDEAAHPAIVARARALKCDMTIVDTGGLEPDAANRALALAVCEAHGTPRAQAEFALACATPDPGHFTACDVAAPGGVFRFANAFACNDVESLAQRWRLLAADTNVVLLNARGDRPLRTLAFLKFLAGLPSRPDVIVAGDPLAFRLAAKLDLNVSRLRARDATQILQELAERVKPGSLLWGVGNYRGVGAALAAEIDRRASTC